MLMPDEGEPRRDLVVIGASAGGVETLRLVVAGLPPDLRAAICIVLHIAPRSPSALGGILQRAGPLPCRPARDGDVLEPGRILVAPPDHHLVVEDRHVRLTVGPRENGHRPGIDVLFRSAAQAGDGRVIGVVLSGTRDDGTAGLAEIKSHGGVAVVQDPDDALYDGMPVSALAHVAVDAVVPAAQVAAVVTDMVNGASSPTPPEPDPGGRPGSNPGHDSAQSSAVTTICPDCGGVLSERAGAEMTQWECLVGHRYSPQSLADAQAEDVESALRAAIRALEDRVRLLHRMSARAEAQGQSRSSRSFRRRAQGASRQAQVVREALTFAGATSLRPLGAEKLFGEKAADSLSGEKETAA